jgi:uncharacterized membrane protein YheB (UPF0754 family)
MVKSMSKKRQDFTIDEKVLEKAKQHIPNLSQFVEECFRQYLGYADGTIPIGNLNDIMEKIGKLQVHASMILQNYDAETERQKVEDEKKNRAWRFLWNDYRVTREPNNQLMNEAVETLRVDADTLEDILDMVLEDNYPETNNWFMVYEEYSG